MTVKIALLGFGTVASGVPFLLKENGEKINQSAHSEIEVAKVLVKDEDEKNRLLAAGNDFNFVTNVDDILSDQDITIVVELMCVSNLLKPLSLVPWKLGNTLLLLTRTFWLSMAQNC